MGYVWRLLIYSSVDLQVVIHAEKTAEADADEDEDLNCENFRDNEDCDLYRRTLTAHTDYIYTQHHGHP